MPMMHPRIPKIVAGSRTGGPSPARRICAALVFLALAGGLVAVAAGRVAADTTTAGDAERARIEYIQRALKRQDSPVPGRRVIGTATGFYVAAQRIVTNHHVVERCAALTVRGIDGGNSPAKTIDVVKAHDLALLSTEAPAPAIAVLRTDPAYRAGDAVATIGFPDQGMPRIEPYLTAGVMLGPDKAGAGANRFVIRADVRQGNSGGAVIDQYGTVIGVISAKIDTVRVYQRTGQTVDNVGFAIAMPPILDLLARHGVTPIAGSATAAAARQDPMSVGRPFTVRISCWL